MYVWDQAGTELATPGSAVRHVSAVQSKKNMIRYIQVLTCDPFKFIEWTIQTLLHQSGLI